MRNLIYHVCALKTNDLWQRNIKQLLYRMHVFDGRKFIAIVHGNGIEAFDDVRKEFSKYKSDITFLNLPNDRNLREVATFRPLLEAVEGRTGTTFYAHTKGNSTYDDPLGALYWRNMMYCELLDGWEKCHRLLDAGIPAVGCNQMIWPKNFRSPYPSRLQNGNWMFAGTFFWFRNDKVFAHPKWHHIPRDRYGAEAWLAGLFEADEVKSVFQPFPADKLGVDPYDPQVYIKAGCAMSDEELYQPTYCI